jgi:tetratricopeptide (TPR) repeat protein
MAAVRAAQERFADSESLLRQALARAGENPGDKAATARILAQLGTLYLRQKRYTDALPPLEQAAALDQQALAPGHPFIADDYYDLGLVFDGLKRPAESHAALRFAVRLLEKGPEKESLRLAYAERELARVLRAAGETGEAGAAEQESKRLIDRIEDGERDRERQV